MILRELLASARRPGMPALVLPGVGTPLEALSAVSAGFPAVYVSGYAVAAWRHGLPDIGLIAAAEISEAVTAVRRVVEVPIVSDADTGYGDVASVTSTVRALEAAGADAIQIEDQVWPKRCGHMSGKEVVDIETAVRKIAAAVAARRSPDTVIIARTDALAPHGIDEAIERGRRFAEAGADVVFVDAPADDDQLRRIGAEVGSEHDVALMVNMSEGGVTPSHSADELSAMGFAVVLFPTSALRVAAKSVAAFYSRLHVTGDTLPVRDTMWGLDELNELVGLDAYQALEARALEADV